MKKYLPLFMLLVSCGDFNPSDPYRKNTVVSVGPFKPYVDLFVAEGRQHGQAIKIEDLIVKFGHIEEAKTLAFCRHVTDDSETPSITIDPDKWAKLLLIQREILVFHELGHCILKRDHLNGMSIMAPQILWSTTYAANEAELLAELFDPAKANSWTLDGEDIQ
jgi:hypothetical protein